MCFPLLAYKRLLDKRLLSTSADLRKKWDIKQAKENVLKTMEGSKQQEILR